MLGSSQWEQLCYESSVPLHGEDEGQIKGPYEYTVVSRRSGGRLLILSEHAGIIEHLLSEEFKKAFIPHLRPISIAIDPLVKSLTKNPSIYALSYAYARVPGGLSNLKSLAFYGEDLAIAALFCDLLDALIFINCGLRLAAKGKEIVRLSTDGGVSFFPTNRQRLDDVEKVLGFIRAQGYLSDSGDVVP